MNNAETPSLLATIRAHLDAFAQEHPQANFDSEAFRTMLATHLAGNLQMTEQGLIRELAAALAGLIASYSRGKLFMTTLEKDHFVYAQHMLQHAKEAGYDG